METGEQARRLKDWIQLGGQGEKTRGKKRGEKTRGKKGEILDTEADKMNIRRKYKKKKKEKNYDYV